MTPHAGTAVFIDHHEARVFHVALGSVDEATVQAPKQHVHRHPKKGTDEHNHPDDMHHFFGEVARALEGSTQILLLGPSTAKLEFMRYVQKHAHGVEGHVVGIETVDHPTDKQLLAHIKAYFGIATPRVS
jgi:stalled ribosome rescue protein Dom34